MKRQKKHKNSSKKRDKKLLKVRSSVFVVGLYIFALFFITPAVFGATTSKNADKADDSDATSIASFIPEGYRYDSTGNADPFLSYLIKRGELLRSLEEQRKKEMDVLSTLRSMQEVRTELQKFDITQLTLSSIVSGSNDVWAMVIDPTGMGHVIKKGSLIGNNGGIVDEIIRKIEPSEYGPRYIRKVIIKEPYISKEGNIEYRFTEKDLVNPYYD